MSDEFALDVEVGHNLPEDEADQFGGVQSAAAVSDLAGDVELLDEVENLLVRILELLLVGDLIEIAEVGVHHPHDDDGVERNVDLEGLRVLIAEFDESAQC